MAYMVAAALKQISCKFKAGFSLQSARFLGNDGDNVVLRQNIVFLFSKQEGMKKCKVPKEFLEREFDNQCWLTKENAVVVFSSQLCTYISILSYIIM